MTQSGRDSRAGVTLLETLIALAVMAMLAVIGTTTLGYSARLLSRAADGDSRAAIAFARHRLRDWMERAVVLSNDTGDVTALSGGAAGLTFQAVFDDGTFWPGAPVTVRLMSEAENSASAVAIAEGLSDVGQRPTSDRLSLSGAAAHLTIRYYGRTSPEASPAWHNSWKSDDGLPLLVRLSISDGSMIYPPLILRPGKAYAARAMTLTGAMPPAPPEP